jgi:hypothetical protein
LFVFVVGCFFSFFFFLFSFWFLVLGSWFLVFTLKAKKQKAKSKKKPALIPGLVKPLSHGWSGLTVLVSAVF